MSDKQYKKLPTSIQTTVIKNFFESTVEQLFSKSNIENISAYIGRKEFDDYTPSTDTYVVESSFDREKYSLEPVVNSIDQLSGESSNLMFYEDFLNVLKSYEVDTQNQNLLFDTNFYSFLPPIDIDKFVNYQEYFWSPDGPSVITVAGTAEQPINILKDILGKKSFTDANGYSLKNGAVVQFTGDYVIPASYKDTKFIVEGVGDSIILYKKEQNFSAPWGNAQENPDYILMQRGATDNNIWSRINFWHHKNTFIDAGTPLPSKQYRAKRPIIEFDRNIELYNFGSKGLDFNIDLVAVDYNKSEIEGRPFDAPIDGQVVEVDNSILIPNDETDISKYVYVIKDTVSTTVVNDVVNANAFVVDSLDNIFLYAQVTADNISNTTLVSNIDISTNTVYTDANVTLTNGDTVSFEGRIILERYPDTTNPSGAVDGDSNFVPFVPQTGDSVSILSGSINRGREYYWDDSEWKSGQRKPAVNTPIKFNVFDTDRVRHDNELVYPNSNFNGSKIFSYKVSSINSLKDSVLGFPLEYKNFNNFSEIVFENNFNTDLTSYVPFGGTTSKYIQGYRYYKITLSNGDVEYRTMWRGHTDPFSQQVEDRYVVNQKNVDEQQLTWLTSAQPIIPTL
jgi:hypothetical protein